MNNGLIALALVALALGVTLMEIFAGTNHAGAPSQRDRAFGHRWRPREQGSQVRVSAGARAPEKMGSS
jgi:hypothetical protein